MQPGRIDDDEATSPASVSPAGSLAIDAAPSAAAATSASVAPMLAWTAARTAPSTSGASLTAPGPVRPPIELLERELEAERGTAQVEQDRGRRPRLASSVDRSAAAIARRARPQATVLRPTGGPHRDLVAGDLRDHVAQAVGQHAAVGDQDQAHQSRLLSTLDVVVDVGDPPARLVKKPARAHQEMR